MGQGFFSCCDNETGTAFFGTDVFNNCMHDDGKLASLTAGNSKIYTEMNNSGECLFESSYFIYAYAPTGTPEGNYCVAIGISSNNKPLYLLGKWVGQAMNIYGYNFYVWSLRRSGYSGTLLGVVPDNDQYDLNWQITTTPLTGKDAKPAFAPLKLKAAPKEGSDRKGDPREKKAKKK